jgi:ATP-dependent Zn protease
MIRNAQSSIYVQVVAQINYINTLSNVVLFCSLGIVVILYFLMILYCFKSNSQLKQSLSNLLYISDSEAHMHQENAEKMKYAVEMIRKNF